MSLLSEKLAPLWSAINRLQARQMSIFPATVTSVNPMRIRIDGESQSLAASPDSLAAVQPGDRVRVLRYGTTHLLLDRIGGTGAMLLDQASLSGPISQSPTLTVPTHLKSTIQKYTLDIVGGSDTSSGSRRLSVHLNGDIGSNYRSNAVSIGADGILANVEFSSTSEPRTAYMNQFLGHITIDFIMDNHRVYWSGRGWQNGGVSGSSVFFTGGRWTGDAQNVSTFDFDSTAGNWPGGSRARLWGYR